MHHGGKNVILNIQDTYCQIFFCGKVMMFGNEHRRALNL